MPTFDYQAVDTGGKRQNGVIEGDSARQVRQKLREKGWVPLAVDAAHKNIGTKEGGSRVRLSGLQLSSLTRQLAVLLRSGMPIESALEAVSKQATNNKVKRLVSVVRGSVREGYSLSESLEQFPKAFNRLFRATVAAGEHAGHLDKVLGQLADYTESERAFRQKTLSALIYPVILMVMAVAIVSGLMVYIVPDIIKVFIETGQTLPLLTRMLVAISNFLQSWGLVVGAVVLFAGAGYAAALNIPRARRQIHRFYLHLPLLSWFSRGLNSERFAHTLAILGSSGVVLHDSLRIALEVVENDYLRERLGIVVRRVEEGESISKSLSDMGYFPPLMVHMVASGESSGELDEMLLRAAHQQQQDLNTAVATAVSLFEPLMLLLMGGIVLVIVLAVLQPIMNMNQLIT